MLATAYLIHVLTHRYVSQTVQPAQVRTVDTAYRITGPGRVTDSRVTDTDSAIRVSPGVLERWATSDSPNEQPFRRRWLTDR